LAEAERPPSAARSVLHPGPRGKVEAIPGAEPVVPRPITADVVIRRDPACSDDLKHVLVDHNRRVIFDAKPEDSRMGINDVDKFSVSLR
jgi:hypothetical protein